MIDNGLISIVLVTYNAQEYLQRCLDSIYNQDYRNLEIVVIDGASTDDTILVIQENADRLAYWISEPDSGIYNAMNKALDKVQGEWIYFIGADDILTPQFAKLAAELIDPHLIYYGSVIKAGKKYLGKMSAYQQAKTGINHQAIIYPARLFSDRRYDERYRISADHVLNMSCHRSKDYRFEFRDFDIAIFNDAGISSLKKDAVFEKEKGKLILRYFGWKIYMRFLFKKMKERLF